MAGHPSMLLACDTRPSNLRLLSSCGHGGLEQPCWPPLWRQVSGEASQRPARGQGVVGPTLHPHLAKWRIGRRQQKTALGETRSRYETDPRKLATFLIVRAVWLESTYYGMLTGAGFPYLTRSTYDPVIHCGIDGLVRGVSSA